ncbi:pyrophosphatase [Microbacterium allomyrinae]|jgi:NTP pyrophosphatase (non-canonical NTP hydrolase)|uniref:Pyrophosphatase n=1 Tax=Microbacterium allomyrinae TaxID=2830666 RepID=A0A9X1LVP7_9MICO|nr:pyrophosphatase [Microbacterium allomyrinae]MCC2032656.1 pyrophosphatase [Microbacterium allomyrinae]
MDIAELQAEVESVSTVYAERHDITRSDDWFILKLGEEVGELTQAYLARSGQARDKGRSEPQLEEDFRAELSDVLAQVLLVAHRFSIDLESEVARKWLVWKPEQAGS